jgi:hypothetical protein
MLNKENKINKGLEKLLNGKSNYHPSVFPPVSFDNSEKRNSYLESFSQALVLDIASNPK